MAITLDTAPAAAATAPARSSRWRQERVFFTGLPLLMAAAVFVGFARSYYLKGLYGTPPLAPLFHWHGLLFTTWMALLIAQPALVAMRRTDIHRRLGLLGGAVAALMLPTAYFVAIDMGRRGAAPPGVPPLSFLIVPMATLVVFPALIGAALLWRHYADTHKRLMLIGTLELVPAGIARWPGLETSGPLAYFGLADLFVLVMLAFDIMRRGRPHPATVWGGSFLVLSQVLRIVVSGTDPWIAFAAWLIG